ncbi:MAG: hypothetical protein IJV07_00720 [Alphaproteobacteria bacterium]|nr:hypothetical protein [Alphaproteobacteria bacterium]
MTQDYKPFLQKVLRIAVRDILADVALNGLRDDSHYFITFQTDRPDVQIPDFVRAKYPEEISIILQNQFSNLIAREDSFSVDLAFGGVSSTLIVPYTAIKVFADPAAQFMLSFDPVRPNTEDKPTSDKNKSADIIDLTSLREKK